MLCIVEAQKRQYLEENQHNPLRAMIKACGVRNVDMVRALSPDIADINAILPGEYGTYVRMSLNVTRQYICINRVNII